MEKTIQISGLSKSYDGKKVIENLSFSVAAGEVYGLLGANGAGKSTAIECILGTKKADSGTVRILGLDPWTERKQLFEQVGVQFQESNYPDRIKVKELCEETACLYSCLLYTSIRAPRTCTTALWRRRRSETSRERISLFPFTATRCRCLGAPRGWRALYLSLIHI